MLYLFVKNYYKGKKLNSEYNTQEINKIINTQSNGIIANILKKQKEQGHKFKYPHDKLNILLMLAQDVFDLKTKDLVFNTTTLLLKDTKVWKTIKKNKNNSLSQLIGVNQKYIMFLAYIVQKYSNIRIDLMTKTEQYNEMMLLTNIKLNLDEGSEALEFFDNVIIPYVNILIYKSVKDLENIQINIGLLNTHLNKLYEESEESDYVFIINYIFDNLKKLRIIN